MVEKCQNKEEDMTYAEFFSEIKGRFMEADVSGIREHLAYQFNITGEAEGIFYIEVKEGKLYVQARWNLSADFDLGLPVHVRPGRT